MSLKLSIDLDGTICETRKSWQSYADVRPIPGAIETLRELKDKGYYIIINTARNMQTQNNNLGAVIKNVGKVTMEWLEKYQVPYDELLFGKPNVDYIIDDKAITFNNWDQVKQTLEQEESKAESKKLCLLINGVTRIPASRIIECIQNTKAILAHRPNLTIDTWLFTWETETKEEEKLKDFVDCLYVGSPPTNELMDKLGIPNNQQERVNLGTEREYKNKEGRLPCYSQAYSIDYLCKKIDELGIKYDYACRARNDVFFSLENDSDINRWFDYIDADQKAYVTPGVVWGDHKGPGDHFGLARYDVIKNVWKLDLKDFQRVLYDSWNFEQYIHKMITGHGYGYYEVPIKSYVIRKVNDWVIR